jgi:hypothetical protein
MIKSVFPIFSTDFGNGSGLGPKLETLKIVTHCSEQRLDGG